MPDIPKLVQSIDSGKYSEKELLALYHNTMKTTAVGEPEKETVIQKITVQLRQEYPRAAKKLLGPVGSKPQEILESLAAKAEQQFDLSQNTVKNGIKAGGTMISGGAPVDWYVSYKDGNKNGVLAGASQQDADAPVVYRVFRYTGSQNADNRFSESEYIGENPAFEETYIQLLEEVIGQAA